MTFLIQLSEFWVKTQKRAFPAAVSLLKILWKMDLRVKHDFGTHKQKIHIIIKIISQSLFNCTFIFGTLFPPTFTTISGEIIQINKSMSVLGITYDFDLSWRSHMENLIKKLQKMISGLKVIRHALTEEQFLTVATAQYYGSLYNGLPVWYHSMQKKHQDKLSVLHYKLLRVVFRDWQMIYPRDLLDTLGRAWPNVMANYSIGSIIINAINHGLPSRLRTMISSNLYTVRRPHQTRSYDAAKKRIGRQAIGNRTEDIVKLFDTNWTTLSDKHSIRKYLKKIFF